MRLPRRYAPRNDIIIVLPNSREKRNGNDFRKTLIIKAPVLLDIKLKKIIK